MTQIYNKYNIQYTGNPLLYNPPQTGIPHFITYSMLNTFMRKNELRASRIFKCIKTFNNKLVVNRRCFFFISAM